MNLLPIPALDGARILFSLVEAIRRKPLDKEKEGMMHWVGLLLLMLLMVIITFNDIVRWIKG
jgi:regulator of sigma E protease